MSDAEPWSGSPAKQDRGDIQYRKLDDVPKRIHVLGTGGVGKLIAHAIRGIPDPPPVSLIFHRPTYYKQFKEAKNIISITSRGNKEDRDGYDAELAIPAPSGAGPETFGSPQAYSRVIAESAKEPIAHLILSVKAHQTASALSAVADRLYPDSTVLFLQNGMGTVDEINEKIFPDPDKRPNYIVGVNSHGIYTTALNAAVHAGHGTLKLCIIPRASSSATNDSEAPEEAQGDPPGARYLLRTITRSPVLGAVGLSPPDLLQAQLEKLVVNCIINPLTVMMDCKNGDLLNNFAISRTIYLLLAEISLVIRSLPELSGIPNVPLRFSPERLEGIVVGMAETTAENTSSMLQDARRGIMTEIEYINGYIVKRGEELGIKPVMNYMLMQMVVGKQQMISKEIDNYTPFSDKDR